MGDRGECEAPQQQADLSSLTCDTIMEPPAAAWQGSGMCMAWKMAMLCSSVLAYRAWRKPYAL